MPSSESPKLTTEQAKDQIRAIIHVAQAMVDTVRDLHPEPVPTGIMYAAYMQAGGSYNDFMQLIEMLCKVERLKRVGNHCVVLGLREIH